MIYKITAVLLFVAAIKADDCNRDIQWVDFYGAIPANAVPLAKNGTTPVYLALVSVDDVVVPAVIYEDTFEAVYSFNGDKTATENVKILCSDHPESFVWHDIPNDALHWVERDYYMVPGGYENGLTTFIGSTLYVPERLGKIVVERDGENKISISTMFIITNSLDEQWDFKVLIYQGCY